MSEKTRKIKIELTNDLNSLHSSTFLSNANDLAFYDLCYISFPSTLISERNELSRLVSTGQAIHYLMKKWLAPLRCGLGMPVGHGLVAAFPAQCERPPPCDALGLDVPSIFQECNP